MDEVVIGLDVGTTAAKASAFALGSTWRVTAVREYPLDQPGPGWIVQDPQTLVTATLAALSECVAACGGAVVVAVSLSSAMHGLVALDDSKTPLTPLLTWADTRADDEAAALRAGPEGEALYLRSGVPVHAMSPLAKLSWFARNDPGLLARARWWVGLKEWLVWNLTGALVTELSSASGTGLLDLAARTWSRPSLDLVGIAEDRLPPVLSPTDVRTLRPEVAARTGLKVGTPVVLGAGDGPLGNVGAGALEPGTAGLSLGTSGALRTVVGAPHVEPGSGLFCYALTEDRWVVGGAISNGGSVVRWAESVFGTDPALARTSRDEAVLALAAQVPPGSDGLTMVPFLLGERSPLWDPSIPGAYLGVRERHTRAHFVRAGVEGVALQLWAVLAQLDRVRPITAVRATGGVFRSPLWTEVVAAALDRPMVVANAAEGSALGAAALGLLALGRASSLEDALVILGVPDDDTPAVVPDPTAVATYREARRRMPELVSGYVAVARTLQDP